MLQSVSNIRHLRYLKDDWTSNLESLGMPKRRAAFRHDLEFLIYFQKWLTRHLLAKPAFLFSLALFKINNSEIETDSLCTLQIAISVCYLLCFLLHLELFLNGHLHWRFKINLTRLYTYFLQVSVLWSQIRRQGHMTNWTKWKQNLKKKTKINE